MGDINTDPDSPDVSHLQPRRTRSGKIRSDDSSEFICVSEEELDSANSIDSIGGRLLDYISEIEKLRLEFKKLQGPISGRMKYLSRCYKDAVSDYKRTLSQCGSTIF